MIFNLNISTTITSLLVQDCAGLPKIIHVDNHTNKLCKNLIGIISKLQYMGYFMQAQFM